MDLERYFSHGVHHTMARKKQTNRFKSSITTEPLRTLYIKLGQDNRPWWDLKPRELKKEDPRLEILGNNLSRTVRDAKEKIKKHKAGGGGK